MTNKQLTEEQYAYEKTGRFVMLALSLTNVLLIVALTCGMVNAVICETWWLVAVLSIGYLPTVFLTYLILCSILMLKHINSYRKK